MIVLVKDIKEATCVTHSGTMHADEVFATAFLDLYLKALKSAKVSVCASFDYINGKDIELEKIFTNKSYVTGLDCDDKKEVKKGRKMLTAAAFTYVASVATTLLEILRLILMVSGRNND